MYDQLGGEHDWDWLVANFGAISLERAETVGGVSRVYRVATLQEVERLAVQVVAVLETPSS